LLIAIRTARNFVYDLLNNIDSTPRDVPAYVRYLEAKLHETLEQMTAGHFDVHIKHKFVLRAYKELVRILVDDDAGLACQRLFPYTLTLVVNILLAHPRYIPIAAKEPYDAEIVNNFDMILRQIGADACYKNHPKNRTLSRHNIAEGARRMAIALWVYPCEREDCVHKQYGYILDRLYRLARKEISSRVYACIGERLPAELCHLVVDAAYNAESINRMENGIPKGRHCGRTNESHSSNWDENLQAYRSNWDYDEEPEYVLHDRFSDESYYSDDVTDEESQASSPEPEYEDVVEHDNDCGPVPGQGDENGQPGQEQDDEDIYFDEDFNEE
jgi:hypothetical protein